MASENSDTSIKIYLREIGQIPLLTPQEEIDLAARIKKGDREARALIRYWRMLRVSDTADDENRKTCWPIPVAGPMCHDGEVCSAQFSADGQRVVTASGG